MIWDYFVFIYVDAMEGVSKSVAEILYVAVAVLLLYRGRVTWKSALVTFIKAAGMWIVIQVVGGILRIAGLHDSTVSMLMMFAVYPCVLIVYAVIFCRIAPQKCAILYLSFYAAFMFTAGVATQFAQLVFGPLGGGTARELMVIATDVVMYGAVCVNFVLRPIDKIAFFPAYTFVMTVVFDLVFIAMGQILHIFVPDNVVLLMVMDALFYVLDILQYNACLSVSDAHDERVGASVRTKDFTDRDELVSLVQSDKEALRRMEHDMGNKFSYMEALLRDGKYDELQSFFSEYVGEYEGSRRLRYNTGNETVDNVLYIENEKARKGGMRIEANTAIPSRLPFADDDLISLLMNALDNAVEGAEACDGSGECIELEMRVWQEYLFIKTVNPVAEGRVGANLETTKADREAHGYGIRIMRSIAEKYEGSAVFEGRDGVFTAQIMLNMRSGEKLVPAEGF